VARWAHDVSFSFRRPDERHSVTIKGLAEAESGSFDHQLFTTVATVNFVDFLSEFDLLMFAVFAPDSAVSTDFQPGSPTFQLAGRASCLVCPGKNSVQC